MIDRSPRAQRAQPGWLGPIMLGSLLLGSASPALAISREDRILADYLIRDIRYLDTAERFLRGLKAESGLRKEDAAEIDALLLDVLDGQGRKAELEKARAEFKRKYPDHFRAALSDLQTIGEKFKGIGGRLERAKSETDRSKAQKLVQDAVRLFGEEVRTPLATLIRGLDAKAQDDEEMRRRRNLAELSRLRFYLLYAGLLPESSKERTKILEEGLELATFFVENRYRFYVMQYEGLIQKGIFLLQLDKHREAAEELSVLYDILPAGKPPYPREIVKAFRDIRLKALLFGVRALNAAGRFREGKRAVETYYLGPSSDDPFYLGNAEKEPDLRRYAILMRLEYAVSLANTGEPRRGLGIIHAIIETYDAQGEKGRAFVIDARKALGKIAAAGNVLLSGRDYYQAAIGLKSGLRFAEALRLLQRALATLPPVDFPKYAPLCLNEIGEVHYLLGEYIQSALAYQELCRHFLRSGDALSSKAATNFLGAVTKAQGGNLEHAGLVALKAEADEVFKTSGRGLGAVEELMVTGTRRMDQNDLAGAKEEFGRVPREYKGQPVPFYQRARALALRCDVLRWQAAPAEEKTDLDAAVDQAVPALARIVADARRDKESLGVAVASLTLGQIHYQREQWRDAVDALEPFLEELAEDTYYRCTALGYLVLAATHLSDGGDEAVAAFREMAKACEKDPASPSAAYALADHFTESGDPEKAAVYMEFYASHAPREDLEDLALVMKIVQVLVDGKLVTDARHYIELAKKIAASGNGETDLERQLVFMDAKILQKNSDLAGVIRTLLGYVKKYGGRGESYEDPYVWRMLAEAYYSIDGAKKKPANLVRAEKCYNNARSILLRGLRARRSSGEKDPALERKYWSWAYRWLRIKYYLGRAGRPDELQRIVLFVDEYSPSGMGGYAEKYFLPLRQKAQQALGRGRARNGK